MKKYGLGARLLSCASLVREGAVLADVGTDHAYLPIYLLSTGKIERAILSDINEGPLASARENARESGFESSVTLVLTDGAAELASFGATDYCICGMGGELIASIIDNAPRLAERGVRLILQPMTRKSVLREYLFTHGFRILREVYSVEDGKSYVAFLAEYDGGRVEFSSVDAEIGLPSGKEPCEAELSYMRSLFATLRKTAEGKERGGVDASFENDILAALKQRYNIDFRS